MVRYTLEILKDFKNLAAFVSDHFGTFKGLKLQFCTWSNPRELIFNIFVKEQKL